MPTKCPSFVPTARVRFGSSVGRSKTARFFVLPRSSPSKCSGSTVPWKLLTFTSSRSHVTCGLRAKLSCRISEVKLALAASIFAAFTGIPLASSWASRSVMSTVPSAISTCVCGLANTLRRTVKSLMMDCAKL